MGNWMMYFVALMAILTFQFLFATGLGLITRKLSFAYYAGFLVMMGIYNYLRFAQIHQGYTGPDEVFLSIAAIFPFLAYYFYFRFVRFFLELRALAPPLDRLARYLEWLSLAYVLIFFLLIHQEALRRVCYFAIAGAMAIGTVLLQVRMLRFRLMVVRLVQWGSLFYFLGMMTGFVSKLRHLLGQPESRIEIDYMSLGLLVEITFFALALAYKLRQEGQEKQQVQEQALQQLRKIQDLNTALQGVRDNIARDLHDDIGSTLGTISLLGAMADERIPRDHPAADLVQRMGEYARSMGESMNDAIWTLNSRNDDAEALIKRMQDFSAVLLTGAGLRFQFEVSPAWEKQVFPMSVRKNIFLIYKESLYNIVRHAAAQSVQIQLEEAPHKLLLRIVDDGRGLDSTLLPTGNGLRNMRKRAEESGLELHLHSPKAGGLQISLYLPLPT